MRLLLVFCLLLLLPVSAAGAARIVAGVVRAVYDGDTILIETRDRSRLKVRLYGVDAPETAKPDMPGQPFGKEARRALTGKVMGRGVAAELVDVDRYQRLVAVIRRNGRDVNREMVAEGMAWAYRRYLLAPYASEYIGAEQQARSRRAGLWRDANPLPPWEFREAPRGEARHKRHR